MNGNTYYVVSVLSSDGSRTVTAHDDLAEAMAHFNSVVSSGPDSAAVWYCDRRWGVIYPVRRHLSREVHSCS